MSTVKAPTSVEYVSKEELREILQRSIGARVGRNRGNREFLDALYDLSIGETIKVPCTHEKSACYKTQTAHRVAKVRSVKVRTLHDQGYLVITNIGG